MSDGKRLALIQRLARALCDMGCMGFVCPDCTQRAIDLVIKLGELDNAETCSAP